MTSIYHRTRKLPTTNEPSQKNNPNKFTFLTSGGRGGYKSGFPTTLETHQFQTQGILTSRSETFLRM
ncbi:hypothetical protein EHQ89_15495 [Leptospira biflexa]|nr:hypothetical protein EHQ89_15495 [Leptospira biflexa]